MKLQIVRSFVQVWFQNARAKYRRAVQLKQDGVQSADSAKDPVSKDEPSSSSAPAQCHLASDSSNLADSLGSSGNEDIEGSLRTESNGSPVCHAFRMSASLPSTSSTVRKSPLIDYTFEASNLHTACSESGEEDCASKSLADYFQNCENTML